MTSKGLELKFEEQMSRSEVKKVQEPEINEDIKIKEIEEEPEGFVLDDW